MGMPEVVIAGGGFGGLYAALALRDAPVKVTVVDRKNYHLFQPLLYQVATAGLSPGDIAQPIRHILRGADTRVVLGEVEAVDAPGRRLLLAQGALGYDRLILALGAGHAYFGHEDWAAHAPGLKTIEDALEIRNRILLAFELAEREPSIGRRRALLSFIVVGGGPTGLELAGAIAELARRALPADFRAADPAQARVILLEAGPRLLPVFSEASSAKALRQLSRLGVETRVSCPVTAVGPGWVEAGGERLEGQVLWAAGVRASPLASSLGVPLDRAGRVLVEPDLCVPGRPEIQVIGDLALVMSPDGRPVPGLAPAAIQMGRHAALNILRSLRGEPTLPFRYKDRGTMATIGRHAAVARLGRWELSGLAAWLAWLLLHIYFLIGFRSRLLVLMEWAWAYVTFDRGVRLITGEGKPRE